MNRISELLDILVELQNEGNIDEICNCYQQKYKDSLSQAQKIIISKTLEENSDLVVFDLATKKWKLINKSISKKVSNVVNNEKIEIIRKSLKYVSDFTSQEYDGSYELMINAINEYKKTGLSDFNVDDMNFVYSCCVGTWKMSVDIKKKRLNLTSLPTESKNLLSKLLDDIWNKAEKNLYYNTLNNTDSTKTQFGMFGAPFQVMQKEFTKYDASKFINMCIDIVDESNEDKIYDTCVKTLNNDYKPYGIKAGVASEILHCLKPFAFPIMNANGENGTIFEQLGIELIKPKELSTYISNCLLIKKYRDNNYSFKNYRIMDVSAWSLNDEKPFDINKYFKEWEEFKQNCLLYKKAQEYNGGIIGFIDVLNVHQVKYKLTSKEPSVRVSIETQFGTLGAYDRKKEKKVRIDIPKNHPLSFEYENIGGYLFNENNKDFESDSYISVYFNEESFDRCIKIIKENI